MKKAILLAVLLVAFGCSHDKPSEESPLRLDDGLFRLQNIHSTKEIPDDLSAFPKLDSAQKMQFIVPIMKREADVSDDYILNFTEARFIGKQFFTVPTILISFESDGYSAVFAVVLDEHNKLISYLRVSGGFCAGPEEINDSFMKSCARRHSVFRNSEIETYVLTEMFSTDSIPKPSIIDSVVYKSVILNNGKFSTTLKDSLRFDQRTR